MNSEMKSNNSFLKEVTRLTLFGFTRKLVYNNSQISLIFGNSEKKKLKERFIQIRVFQPKTQLQSDYRICAVLHGTNCNPSASNRKKEIRTKRRLIRKFIKFNMKLSQQNRQDCSINTDLNETQCHNQNSLIYQFGVETDSPQQSFRI